jgi:hypothetical protein
VPSNPWCPNGAPLRTAHHLSPTAAAAAGIGPSVIPAAARRHPAR